MKTNSFFKLCLLASMFCHVNLHAQISAYYNGSVTIDNDNNANGMIGNNIANRDGVMFGNFNNTGTGTGITSPRLAGSNNFGGLNFYTGFSYTNNASPKMTLTQDGNANFASRLNVGSILNTNSMAQVEIKTSNTINKALQLYPIYNNATRSISVYQISGKPILEFDYGINDKKIQFESGPDGLTVQRHLWTSTNFTSMFRTDDNVGMIFETPALRLKYLSAGPANNSYLTIDTSGKVILNTLPINLNQYWSANGNHIYNLNTNNVGIGTSTPTAKLHCITNSNGEGLSVENTKSGGATGIYAAAHTSVGLGYGAQMQGSNTGVLGLADENLDNMPTSQQVSFEFDLKGLHGYALNSGTTSVRAAKGVYGQASSASENGDAIGVYGEAEQSNAGGRAIGLYGQGSNSNNTSNEWALYANGRSFTTGGVWTPSDARLKTNIKEVHNALEIIEKLHAKSYEFRHDGKYQESHLPYGMQYGFMAQELESALPEAVTKAPLYFSNSKEKTHSAEEINAVNYTVIIPILTQAIKEQQQQIDELKSMLTAKISDEKINQRETYNTVMAKASLYQNRPNPFTSSTSIDYAIYTSFQKASIAVYDLNGRQLTSFPISDRKGSIVLQGNVLEPGMYLYSLIIDGEMMDSKKMTLTN